MLVDVNMNVANNKLYRIVHYSNSRFYFSSNLLKFTKISLNCTGDIINDIQELNIKLLLQDITAKNSNSKQCNNDDTRKEKSPQFREAIFMATVKYNTNPSFNIKCPEELFFQI